MFNKTKFPGKPSKLVNKKRVSVLSHDNNFVKSASDHCESDGEKNLASPKHGYQVSSESLHFCNCRRQSRSVAQRIHANRRLPSGCVRIFSILLLPRESHENFRIFIFRVF